MIKHLVETIDCISMASVVKPLTVLPVVGYGGCSSKQKIRIRCLSLGSKNLHVKRTSLVSKSGRVGCMGGVEEVSGVEDDDDVTLERLEPLWDDGHGSQSVKDFLDIAKEIIKPDGGPPRWFCPVECGCPLKNSPVLLYLPGLDGLGAGLVLHHRALGKVFEVQCLHIPFRDRTPFEGLVAFVESTVRLQHSSAPDMPIYIVGDSFGGCIALAVAARNPTIDLVLILVNPATSLDGSLLQQLLPIFESFADGFESAIPYVMSIILGDPLNAARVNVKTGWLSEKVIGKFFDNMIDVLPSIQVLADNIPKDSFQWKLELQKVGASYSVSRLHAVKSEVLLLASGKDKLFQSQSEAERLSSLIPNCQVQYFEISRHNLLMEDDINLLTVIKGTCIYRRSRRKDWVSDFLPPSISEYNNLSDGSYRIFGLATSPAMFSTMDDGKIVRGLGGVPSKGPVILVGYHMLLGAEVSLLVLQFLKEKNIMVHGLAYREIFSPTFETSSRTFSLFDNFKVFGSLPVTTRNICKVLSNKSFVLLYPGGIREALHRKGENYKLFWPDQPEIVRLAAKFGATIVPFGAVGEDDMAELLPGYNDLLKIPFVNDLIRHEDLKSIKLRTEKDGEVSYDDLFFPVFYPKIPGRFYFLFGKPIEMKGKEDMLKEEEYRKSFYMHIKSEVERSISYLLKKREEDPCRGLLERTIYRTFSAPIDHVPSFEP